MNSSMNPGRSIRASSLKQGSRGWVTSRSVVPTCQHSPTRAPVTSRPSVVRFSPKVPEAVAPPIEVLARVRVHGLAIAAVDLAVGLIVAAHVDAAHRDAPGDRIL